MRQYTALDFVLAQIDQSLRTVHATPPKPTRPAPDKALADADMNDKERDHAAGLMRINHTGEIAAQGLYHGQAATAKLQNTREKMEQAALEEGDHLYWCEKRLEELGHTKSLFGPFWYWGSYAIGASAGAAGDRWSLGFVNETETQVVKHLEEHVEKLPAQDEKSRAILKQMRSDEQEHADWAKQAGGKQLPFPVRQGMKLMAKVMKATSYRV